MTAPAAIDVVETHCPYCALQCGIVARTSPTLSVVGNRAYGETPDEAWGVGATTNSSLPTLPAGQRAALELVADSVVDRYA